MEDVESSNNPADDASRGLGAQELCENARWWNGPDFLWKQWDSQQPVKEPAPLSSEDPEVKRVSTLATGTDEKFSLLKRLEYFSIWHKARRAVAVCLRLQDMFRNLPEEAGNEKNSVPVPEYEPVNVQDLKRSETVIVKQVQRETFLQDIETSLSMNLRGRLADRQTARSRNNALKRTSSLYRLDPFIDNDSVLRVGGHIRRADLPDQLRHPVILPRKGHVAELVICHCREKTVHQGHGLTRSEIRGNGF